MKIKIGPQLAIGFAVPCLLILIMAAVAYASLASLLRANDAVVRADRIEATARDYVAQRTAKRFAIRNIALWAKPSDFAAIDKAVAAMQSDVQGLDRDLADSPGDLAIVNQIGALGETVNARDDVEIAAVRRNRALALQAFQQTGVFGVDPAVYKALRDNAVDVPRESQLSRTLVTHSAARSKDVAIEVASTFRGAVILLAASLAIALILASIIATVLARRITRRLRHVRSALNDVVVGDVSDLSTAFRAMATGDLTATFASARAVLDDSGHDEISDLAQTYNALTNALTSMSAEFAGATERLSGVIRNVQNASAQLSAASSQMSAATMQSETAVQIIAKSMDEVARGARAQSEQLAKASLALEEVSQSSSQISGGAAYQANSVQAAADSVAQMDTQIAGFANLGDQLAAAARDAAAQAQAGTNAVDVTAQAMRTLREHAEQAQMAMAALERRSMSVSEILRTIDEIADQTNLLALNAAIEAARAGDHGRGFAVVADEIRKLAERASGSTKEITEILGGVRTDTERVSQAMQSSSSAMNDGISRAEHAASALQIVEGAIATTKQAAEEMAVRAEQMRASSVRLTESLGTVSSVVGENAAATNQMNSTLSSVSTAIAPVADSAIEQSTAADGISSSAADLAAQLEQLSATASELQTHAGMMRALAETFRVPEALKAAPHQPALMGAG